MLPITDHFSKRIAFTLSSQFNEAVCGSREILQGL